jgi:CelD/BcsL family acetyltransferase involved in cellulose biosynthesis
VTTARLPAPCAPQEANLAARGARIRVAAVQDPRELRAHLDAWEDLAQNAAEDNPFYEPWMLLPALEAAAPREALELVLVFAGDQAGRHRLIGLFPLERLARHKGLPLGVLRLWRHALCYLCTPLLRRGCERECLDGFFRWLERDSGASLLRLQHVSGEGPFHHALIRHFERHPQRVHFTEGHTRALFRPRRSAAGYLRAALPGRKLKEFRRLWRRLAERGPLAVRALGPQDRAEDWIGAFLELEARGWKGRAGTALATTPGGGDYFERIALEAHRRGRLVMHGLYLGERALALSCKFRAGDGAYAYKIAFDEDYEQFSPGALLELECIVRMHGEPRIGWMDSCAVPDHFMANQLWPDRRALETVTVAAGGAGGLVVLLLPLLRWARQRLASAA